tara:strand:+ start:128 stop:508 length:381 start_codon:yes stop_codon:yes gene_type:complete
MGQLKEWLKQDWVRIGSDGSIKGKCGTSKDKKNPDRCLPRAKAQSLSKSERATTARKKKRAGAKGKTVVSNTRAAKVRKMGSGGVAIPTTTAKRPYKGKNIPGSVVARGCGAVMPGRRKRTTGSVS